MPSSSNNPSLASLSQPQPLDNALAEQKEYYDCLPCKLMGSAAFAGLGIYSYASGMSELKKKEREILKSGSRFGIGPRKGGIYLISGVLVGLGVWRLKV